MRAQQSHVVIILALVEDHAKALGLIPPYLNLSITAGSNITPHIQHFPHLGPGQDLDLSFLPTFEKGHRSSKTDVYLALSATEKALGALRRRQERTAS